MEAQVSVQPATADDIDEVLRVQEASPGAACWKRTQYEEFLQESRCIFLVAGAGSVAGFLAARMAADELEILNLAVEPQQRRRGIGARLLQEALAEGRTRGARSAWLEVRDSNQGARALYGRFGFRETYRRPRFYQDPTEDAVVCRRALEPPPIA